MNLTPLFHRTVEHYRPVLDGLFKHARTLSDHERDEQICDIRDLGIKLLLISRAAEISIRGLHDRVWKSMSSKDSPCSKHFLSVLDTVSEMDLYRDLIQRLLDRYKEAFYSSLTYDNLITTTWESQIHAQVEEAETEGWRDAESKLRLELIRQITGACSQEPGDAGERESVISIHRVWSSYLIAWRNLLHSHTAAIRMMRHFVMFHSFHS